jgi:Flp pilus assembly protein RcpC/CpaB
MRRSNNILFIGVGVFAVGALLAFFGLKANDKPVATPQSAPIAAATPGTEVRTVNVGQPAGAVQGAATFTIPKGKQAVSVEIPAVAGLAGYVKPGDTINIYGAIKNETPNGKLKQPLVKLALAGVKVLDVRAPAVGTGGASTYLLALDVNEAEQVIFYAKYESMWIALTTPEQKPVSSKGRSYQNIL